MYDQSVPSDGSYALRVWDANQRTGYFYDFNKNASEYYKGSENKLALYFTHDWDVTNKLNLYYGARLEWQKLKGENAAVKNANGDFVGRFADYCQFVCENLQGAQERQGDFVYGSHRRSFEIREGIR